MTEESYHIRLVTLGGVSVGKSAILKVTNSISSFLRFYSNAVSLIINFYNNLKININKVSEMC